MVPCLPSFDKAIYTLINFVFALFNKSSYKSTVEPIVDVVSPKLAEVNLDFPRGLGDPSNSPVIDSYCELSLKIEHILTNDCCHFVAFSESKDTTLPALSRNDLVDGAHNSSEFVVKFEQGDPSSP